MFAYGSRSLNDPLDQIEGAKTPGIADMSFSAAAGERIKNTGKPFTVACFGRTAWQAVPGWQLHYR